MCRNGKESTATTARRCACSPARRKLYDTKRLMGRYARQIATPADTNPRAWPLFMKHFYALADQTGERFPPVPDVDFSRAREFSPGTCDWMSDDLLDAAYIDCGDDPLAQEAVGAEMDRREELLRQQRADADTQYRAWVAEEERIEAERGRDVWDRLASETQADADDPLLNPALRRGPRSAEQECRRSYEEYVESSYMQAESACRGELLNARAHAKGISARSLFTGNLARADAYASEELKNFWNHTPRLTYSAFRYHALGWASDREAAQNAKIKEYDDVANVA